MKLKVKKMHQDSVLPSQANSNDAGYDLTAIDDGTWNKDRTYIEYKTGISIQPPDGYHTEIFPRSSISKTDLVLANSIGLVDQGYSGEILLRFKYIPNRAELKLYKKGDRIGQLVIRKTEKANFVEVNELSETERGDGGFGSSDRKK